MQLGKNEKLLRDGIPDNEIICSECDIQTSHEWNQYDHVWMCSVCGNVVEDEDVEGNPMQSYNEMVAHVAA